MNGEEKLCEEMGFGVEEFESVDNVITVDFWHEVPLIIAEHSIHNPEMNVK